MNGSDINLGAIPFVVTIVFTSILAIVIAYKFIQRKICKVYR